MNGLLIYSREEAKRNAFSIKKYTENLNVKLMLEEDADFSINTDFVINRTNHFAIAKNFEERGVRVFNPSSLTQLANNKQACYEFMDKNGIEIMPVHYDKVPAVKKAVNGKGGTDVFMIQKQEPFQDGFVYQKPASDLGRDLRVWLIGGKIVCAVLRESKTDFRANFCLGGKAELYKLNAEEELLVYNIASLVNYDYIGIDFVFNGGKIVFNEIEDSVGARMIYSLTNMDIIKEYCDYIRNEVKYG